MDLRKDITDLNDKSRVAVGKHASKPPEKQFFDKPRSLNEIFDLLRKNKWFWRIVMGGGAVLVIGALFVFQKPHKPSPKADMEQQEEKRLVKTRSSIEESINAGLAKEAPKALERPQSKGGEKINLSSPMAVFIFDKEKEEKRAGELMRERTEETKRLGLPSGTKIDALLPNQIFSFNVEAPVIAHVAKEVLWKEAVVIPKDAKFFGSVNIVKSLDRINVSFTKLIFTDGREVRVRAMALSQDGSGGVKGKVEKHQDKKVFKAIGEALIGTASIASGSFNRDSYSLQDELRVNLAQGLTNQARDDLRDVKINTSITVPAYTPIQILLLESV